MNYQKFIEGLPTLYQNWERPFSQPLNTQFKELLNQTKEFVTPVVLQLLNFAVECLEPGDVYCEIGCQDGTYLLGALINHPECIAYAVDDFSFFDVFGDNLDHLLETIEQFNLSDQVFFCNQTCDDFCNDLSALETEDKIGVFFYNSTPGYHSHLAAITKIKPFLDDQALLIVTYSHLSSSTAAHYDFIQQHPQCCLLYDFTDPSLQESWQGIQILGWNYQSEARVDDSSQNVGIGVDSSSIQSTLDSAIDLDQQAMAALSLQWAIAAQEQGDLTQADLYYRQSLQWNPYDPNVWELLCQLHAQQQDYQQALKVICRSLDWLPNHASLHYWQGVAWENLRQIPDAIAAYQNALSLDSQQFVRVIV
jgi:protein O-GlcNAc transferase